MEVCGHGTLRAGDHQSRWHDKPNLTGTSHHLKKTLGIHDSPSGGNSAHLTYIKEKVGEWVSRMSNGHLPSHMAWVAYRHQLWPGVRYGLGTMTNDLKVTDNLLPKEDYRMLNVLGVVCSVTKGLRRLHTSFGGFGLFNLPVEQLIC